MTARPSRKAVPEATERHILLSSGRRCPICYWLDDQRSMVRGQIAHLDHNPANPDYDNLCFMCVTHHEEYDRPTIQTKNFTAGELKKLRDDLYAEIEFRREAPRSVGGESATLQGVRLPLGTETGLPRDFFGQFGPGVSRDLMTSLLGPAHRQNGAMLGYRFSNGLAQFDFGRNSGADSVALALTINSPDDGFQIPGLSTPLGQLTLGHLMDEGGGTIRHRDTTQTWEILYEVQYPPTWLSKHFTFSAMFVKAPGILAESVFDGEAARAGEWSKLQDVLITWMAVSMSAEEAWFDYSLGLPVSL